MADETCYCPCCKQGIPAPHEYHLERRPMPVMQGTWTLTAPDGRTWQADSPLRCAANEQAERIPAHVRVQRLFDAAKDTP